VAATNRDLAQMIRAGTFREDLYHRLAVFPLRLPALRERPRDLLPIADHLLGQISAELGRAPLRLGQSARSWLLGAELRGNIRELRNLLERAAILADHSLLQAEHLALDVPRAPLTPAAPHPEPATTLEQVERVAIQQALEHTAGNRKRAAERLGIGVRTLYEKLKRYELG
jgi:two-component system response regulator FlrC